MNQPTRTDKVYFGRDVVISDAAIVPRLKLSEICPCTDEFRAEFNAWLIDTFGVEHKILAVGNEVHMSQQTYVQLFL